MKKLFGMVLILFSLMPLFASYNQLGIPDSSEIRSELEEQWFTASLNSIRNNPPEIRNNDNGERFQIRLEENDSTFNVFVSPEAEITVNVITDKGSRIEKQKVYPGDAAGSWVLIRDKKTGTPLRIRYYFVKNSEVFIQFTPKGRIALADLVIFGNYAARGVPTGMPFEKFYVAPFEDVRKITETKLPWSYVTIDTQMYHSIQQMIGVIQEKLPFIQIVPDAMFDENGKLTHISNGKAFDESQLSEDKLQLSSAGFVKWIADGLVEPLTGGLLKREPLLKETVEVKDIGRQGILGQKYDLFFSLNWIRNLSSAVVSIYTGTTYLFNESGVDVNINPFASTISDKGVANIVTFVENSGYTTSVLRSLLYVLANTEPGTFYFGAIRGTDRTVSPEIKAFNDCAAFFPYFRDDGSFACTVFMNGRQFTLDDFCLFYADDFVYLTKVKSQEQFFPK